MADQPMSDQTRSDQPMTAWSPAYQPASGQPLVSVITAVYNCEAFLSEAIAGVVAQSYSNWEYLLVNDGSTDGTIEIARQAAAAHPGRIHYLEHSGCENRGACSSRNLALAHARGKYIAILDADDLWLTDKLAEQVALTRQYPRAGLIYGSSEYWLDPHPSTPNIGVSGQRKYVPPLAPAERLYEPPELMRITYPLGPYGAPCPSSMLIDREVLGRIGGFEERFDRHQAYEDQALLAKLYLAAPVYVSRLCLDRYRVHARSCCAVAERTGRVDEDRRFYFDWLHNFFVSAGIEDKAIWQAWRRETLCYRRPVLHFMQRAARGMKRRLRLS